MTLCSLESTLSLCLTQSGLKERSLLPSAPLPSGSCKHLIFSSLLLFSTQPLLLFLLKPSYPPLLFSLLQPFSASRIPSGRTRRCLNSKSLLSLEPIFELAVITAPILTEWPLAAYLQVCFSNFISKSVALIRWLLFTLPFEFQSHSVST